MLLTIIVENEGDTMPLKHTKKKIQDFLFDHDKVKLTLEILRSLGACVIVAVLYSFGYRCFMLNTNPQYCLVAGGMSGFSQIITKILEIIGLVKAEDVILWQPIFNYLLNIPIFIIGWKFVGKRFAIFTLTTVLFISLFTYIMPDQITELFDLSTKIAGETDPNLLPRALFAGICTGLATVFAFKNGTSTGGLDVVALAVANKKSTSIGKYLVLFNGLVLLGYTICSYFSPGTKDYALKLFMYSAIYLFTNALMNDFLNGRNKKAQIQIITTNENISNILIANFPHGCTVVNAKGAFSKEDRIIIYMAVSTAEVHKVVHLVQMIDPHAFVNVTMLQQVYGRFFIEPFK